MDTFANLQILGRVSSQVTIAYTQQNMAIAEFDVVRNKNKKDKDGNWKQNPLFLSVTIFGKRAEIAKEKIHKGQWIVVFGELTQDTWTGKDGLQKTKLKLECDRWASIDGSEPQKSEQQDKQAYLQDETEQESQTTVSDGAEDDRNIPF